MRLTDKASITARYYSHRETLFATGLVADCLLTWNKRGFLGGVELYTPEVSSVGFIVPSDGMLLTDRQVEMIPRTPGRGNRRKYTFSVVRDLFAMRVLTERGVPVNSAVAIAPDLWFRLDELLREERHPEEAVGRFVAISPSDKNTVRDFRGYEVVGIRMDSGWSDLMGQPAALFVDLIAMGNELNRRLDQIDSGERKRLPACE
jgi:hypothetical protein